jgi:hypothetical protein
VNWAAVPRPTSTASNDTGLELILYDRHQERLGHLRRQPKEIRGNQRHKVGRWLTTYLFRNIDLSTMKLYELKRALQKYPESLPRFVLPDGDPIPAHAHVTEVGHALKNFIDCGGVTGKTETVLLQTHVGDDSEHCLTSKRLAKILELGDHLLPHDRLDVEVEYNCCVVAQYPIAEAKPAGEHLDLILENKRTQCLARERAKARSAPDCCGVETCC